MVTNLGRDVRTACAAARAGISRLAPVSGYTAFEPDEFEAPVIGGPIVGLTDGFAATGTFVRLAQVALDDLIGYGGLPAKDDRNYWRRTALVWCLPEITVERFMWPEDEVADILRIACAERLSDVTELPLKIAQDAQLPQGHIGPAHALSIINDIAAGAERVILLATDSYLDDLALRLLFHEDRVKSAESPTGLIPGEAAAAILLEDGAAPSSHCGPQCHILGAAALPAVGPLDENDVPAARRSMAPAVGRNLAAVITSVLDDADCESFQGSVFLDLNGEEWKATAWGIALLQLGGRLDHEHLGMDFPSVSFGEIGAASAVAAVCLAARAFVRRYADADHALVLSMGDSGQVSAILLHAAG